MLRTGPDPDVGYIWPGESEAEVATVRLAVVTHASRHNIELLEYTNSKSPSSAAAPRPSQRGGCHLAFHVEDVQAAVDHLAQFDGVRVLGRPVIEQGGAVEGLEWVYILTPWCMAIELLHWEPGLPYESTTEARMARRAFPRD